MKLSREEHIPKQDLIIEESPSPRSNKYPTLSMASIKPATSVVIPPPPPTRSEKTTQTSLTNLDLPLQEETQVIPCCYDLLRSQQDRLADGRTSEEEEEMIDLLDMDFSPLVGKNIGKGVDYN